MTQHLLLTLWLHDRRYHGVPEWPPAPARVFQALVAGSARGSELPDETRRALEWLEELSPPTIAAPAARVGAVVELFVPNNDGDAVGGDPAKIGEIRTKKEVRPRLLDGDAPFVYAWTIPSTTPHASAVVDAAANLYQFGRGVDMAWAVGELADGDALSKRLDEHRGPVYRPTAGDGGSAIPCPARGTLASLVARHQATLARIRTEISGGVSRTLFAQPPKPRFAPVRYSRVGHWSVLELRDRDDDTKLWPNSLPRVSTLIERIRDAAASRLRHEFPDQLAAIERALVGRKPDGRDDGGIDRRVRLVPLPSIGHQHVDPGVRRIAIDIPADCGLRRDDVQWAFSNLEVTDPQSGESAPFVLAPTVDREMLDRYITDGARRWRSITAVALPTDAQRRRIEPSRKRDEAKGATERVHEESRARAAVRSALRHAGIRAAVVDVRVQREPFQARGSRAEAFAAGTRFAKERLWHVEIELDEAIRGPVVIGDGRFLGLGVMVPEDDHDDGVFAFAATTSTEQADHELVARALRRAIMARAQAEIGTRPLGRFFSGHEDDGVPARSARSNHLAVQWDADRRRLLIVAPHALDRRMPTSDERAALHVLARALEGFTMLRAGRAGLYELVRCSASQAREYARHARAWISASPYSVTRHSKSGSAAAALTSDVTAECARRNLPHPAVTVLSAHGARGHGLEGALRLDFDVAVAGPIVLGRTRHLGGGLFVPVVESSG